MTSLYVKAHARGCIDCAPIRVKMATGDSAAVAKATFELANDITSVSSLDAVFHYDHGKQQELLSARPWIKE